MLGALVDVGLLPPAGVGLSPPDGVRLLPTVVGSFGMPGNDTEHAATPSNATAPTTTVSFRHRPVVN